MRITLHPCKVHEHRVVRDRKSEPLLLEGPDFLSKFLQGRRMTRQTSRLFTTLKTGAFIGLARYRGGLRHFVLQNNDPHDNRFKWINRTRPGFLKSVEEVYQILEIDWGATLEIMDTP